jgi:hypothetical protein
MESKRYMLIIIGNSEGVSEDLNYIADKRGVNFIGGTGLFIGTFYTPLTITDVHKELSKKRPTFLLTDITNRDDYAANLPEKYLSGLFPETVDFSSVVENKVKPKSDKTNLEEESPLSLDDILDKINQSGMESLTMREKKYLDSISK